MSKRNSTYFYFLQFARPRKEQTLLNWRSNAVHERKSFNELRKFIHLTNE